MMFHALIVDDHSGFRGSVSNLLHQRFPFIEVDEVDRGVDALRRIRERGADLVLLDIRLSGVSGILLTKTIKSGWDGITVVVLSAFDLPQYRQAAFRSGADCFLYKGSPSFLNDVIARVEGAILGRGQAHLDTGTSVSPSCPPRAAE